MGCFEEGAGGGVILAFCQQDVWRTASLERKWSPLHSNTRLCPPPSSLASWDLERGQSDQVLEWEVFNCQMLNRLCSLHLAQDQGQSNAHTNTCINTIRGEITRLSESVAENQRWWMSGVWLYWRTEVCDCDPRTKEYLQKVKLMKGKQGQDFRCH